MKARNKSTSYIFPSVQRIQQELRKQREVGKSERYLEKNNYLVTIAEGVSDQESQLRSEFDISWSLVLLSILLELS